MELKIKILDENAKIPVYAKEGDSGFDLFAIRDYIILPQQCKVIGTGIAIEIPANTEIQIRPRSGVSSKTRLRIANSPATIDSGFRGELCIIMENIDNIKPEHIHCGDRIAQAVLCPVLKAEFKVVDELSSTRRGNKGLGSTGGFTHD
jgi:dUTP pyrophosphatase